MKKFLSDYGYLFLIATIVVILDQLTKSIVRNNLILGEVYLPDFWLTQYARIVHWKNTGAAFGIFQNMSSVFTLLSFIVAGAIVYYFPQVPRQDWALRLAMGLLLGGATGNLIDRLRQGYVTDFLSVGKFPVFNVADASISLGVVVLFLGMWQQERQHRKQVAAENKEQLTGEPSAANEIESGDHPPAVTKEENTVHFASTPTTSQE